MLTIKIILRKIIKKPLQKEKKTMVVTFQVDIRGRVIEGT